MIIAFEIKTQFWMEFGISKIAKTYVISDDLEKNLI